MYIVGYRHTQWIMGKLLLCHARHQLRNRYNRSSYFDCYFYALNIFGMVAI